MAIHSNPTSLEAFTCKKEFNEQYRKKLCLIHNSHMVLKQLSRLILQFWLKIAHDKSKLFETLTGGGVSYDQYCIHIIYINKSHNFKIRSWKILCKLNFRIKKMCLFYVRRRDPNPRCLIKSHAMCINWVTKMAVWIALCYWFSRSTVIFEYFFIF